MLGQNRPERRGPARRPPARPLVLLVEPEGARHRHAARIAGAGFRVTSWLRRISILAASSNRRSVNRGRPRSHCGVSQRRSVSDLEVERSEADRPATVRDQTVYGAEHRYTD